MKSPVSRNFLHAVEEVNEHFVAAIEHGNALEAAEVYTERAEIEPPNEPTQEGKPAIQAYWKHLMDCGVKHAHMKTVELEPHGNTAYEVGEYQFESENGQIFDEGKYVIIWKREQGDWKWHRDIWNSIRPLEHS